MSKRLLTLFSGVIALLLFASVSAEAAAPRSVLYQSNLVCNINGAPISATGFTQIGRNGQLFVDLEGLTGLAGERFACAVFCPLTGTSAQAVDCGKVKGEKLLNIIKGLASSNPPAGTAGNPPLSPVCAEPSVEVFQCDPLSRPDECVFNPLTSVFCDSGFVTP